MRTGLVVQLALTLAIEREKIAEYELIAGLPRLQQLDFAVLDEWLRRRSRAVLGSAFAVVLGIDGSVVGC